MVAGSSAKAGEPAVLGFQAMSFTDPSSFRLPRLRFLPVEQLVPHEQQDDRRTGALTSRLQDSGVLKNPPVVTSAEAIGDPRYVVLDGANRVATLKAAGFPHAVVQIVDYDDSGVRLTTWHHALTHDLGAEIEKAIGSIPGLSVREMDLTHARALLARREAIAFLVRANACALSLHGGQDLHERNSLLNAVVDRYRSRVPYYRVTRDSLEDARARYPDVQSLLVFPHFHPEEILEVALSGARLPAGITRHVIAWRALRLNLPLNLMADRDRTLDEKNRWLEQWIADRTATSSVRFYEESTVLFDE
jgi:hypothetical protein